MTPRSNRTALQTAIALCGLVPVGAGLAGILLGPRLAGLTSGDLSLDSHFRYLSGLLLAIGLLFWASVPTIERQGWLVRALTLIVVVGGLGRAMSVFEVGEPDTAMRLALVMELIITPLICLWQYNVERQFQTDGRTDHAWIPLRH